MFKVNDKVRVIDKGRHYSNWEELAKRLGAIKWENGLGYEHNKEVFENGMEGVIKAIDCGAGIALVDFGKNEFLVGLDGLKKTGETKMLKEPTFYVDELVRQTNNLNGKNSIVKITGIDLGKGFIYHKHTGEMVIWSGDYNSFEKIPIEAGDKIKGANARSEFVVDSIEVFYCPDDVTIYSGSYRNRTISVDKKYAILIEKGGTMSKFERIREKIRNLKDGWNKDADDVLQEIDKVDSCHYMICIGTGSSHYIEITNLSDYSKSKAKFFYNSQCGKLTALKNAFLWRLDNSDIKNAEKQEKVKELQDKVKDLQRQLDGLVK